MSRLHPLPERRHAPRIRTTPGQMRLDELLRAYPEAQRFVWTRNGHGLAVLRGGEQRDPETPVAAPVEKAA